jgi:hypothetical protein
MKRAAGHASLFVGRILHDLGRLAFLVFILLLLAVCALAFRLSIGPMELPGLASRLATAASGQGVHVEMGEAALAWGGWRDGGVPFYLALGDIHITNATGLELAAIPSARLIFAPDAIMGAGSPIIVQSRNARFPGASVPVSLVAAIRLSRLHFAQADLSITLGPGRLTSGPAISGGAVYMRLTPVHVSLTAGILRLAPHGASAPVIKFAGTGTRQADWSGTLTLTADRLAAPDLAAYWPPPLLEMTRHWVLANITAGTAMDATFTFGLTAPPTLASLRLTSGTGSFVATGVSLGWIPGAQPITGLTGHVTLQNLDTMVITGDSASLGGVQLRDGIFTITGLTTHRQHGALTVQLGGRVENILAVLGAAPLSLLRHVPPEVAAATGDATGTLTLALPLINHLRLQDVTLGVTATLQNTGLATPLDGLNFTNGSLAVLADKNSLAIAGSAQFAGQPATVGAKVIFNAHPAVQQFDLTSTAGPIVLHHFGLDAEGFFNAPLAGTAPFTFHVIPSGDAPDTEAASLQADLTPVALATPRFGWSKQPGDPASLSLDLTLPPDAPAYLERVFATGPNLFIMAQREGTRIMLRRLVLGRTQASGAIQPPAGNTGWVIALAGPILDYRISPKHSPLAKPAAAKTAPAAAKPPAGPAWRISLSFAQLYLAAAAPALQNFRFAGHGLGNILLAASLTANHPQLAMLVSPAGPQQHLMFSTPDTGAFLQALGLYQGLQGGTLGLDAMLGGDSLATGTAALDDFRLAQAPGFTKFLQALTIYGVGAATSGPGLHFDHLVAPFTLYADRLTLNGARAFSPSLGFTASGNIFIPSGELDLQTTIIPAYALNALPGELPLVGPLFRAEKGGGLIAMNAQLTGTPAAPEVMVNPLSALTPGALREVFQGIGK